MGGEGRGGEGRGGTCSFPGLQENSFTEMMGGWRGGLFERELLD